MYRIELALTEQEILEFEKLRNKIFHGTKTIEKKTQSPFAQAIEKGDLLAFQCLEDETLIGGMLIRLVNNNIELMRMFVDREKRSQGAGDFMVQYLDTHKQMLEDYYGVEHIDGCFLSPTQSGVDYWYSKGFNSAGDKMYKPFKKLTKV